MMNISDTLNAARHARIVIGLGAAIMLIPGGCAEDYRIDPIVAYHGFDGRADATLHAVDLDSYRFPEQTGGPTAYARAVNDSHARHRLMAILFERSDRMYEIHVSKVLATSSGLNSGLDFSTMVLGGLGGLLTGGSTPNALATAAGLTAGTRAIIENRIYFQLFIPEMLRHMDGARAAQRAEMNRLRASTTYTVDDMLGDMREYHRRGSFIYGITSLAKGDQVAAARRSNPLLAGIDLAATQALPVQFSDVPFAVIKWTPSTTTRDAAGYVVMRYDGLNPTPTGALASGVAVKTGTRIGSGTVVATTDGATTALADPSVEANRVYTYAVYSYDANRAYTRRYEIPATSLSVTPVMAFWTGNNTKLELSWRDPEIQSAPLTGVHIIETSERPAGIVGWYPQQGAPLPPPPLNLSFLPDSHSLQVTSANHVKSWTPANTTRYIITLPYSDLTLGSAVKTVYGTPTVTMVPAKR